MQRSTDRILTTHVGSLVRPKELIAKNAEIRENNDYGDDTQKNHEYDAALLKKAVADVVKKQAEIGIDIVNDGEFGKFSWANYIMGRISGFEVRKDQLRPLEWLGNDRERFKEFFAEEMPMANTGVPTEACIGPIKYLDHTDIRRDVANLNEAFKGSGAKEAFFTTVAPASTAYDGINEYYKSDEEYVFAIAEALREEYMEVHNAGLLLQVDDAVLANMFDYLVRKSPEEYHRWAALRVEALNHALRDIPADRVRYHLCFGSWHVPHVADASLKDVVEHILRVNAGAYCIEAANVRHEHEWRLWETVKLPQDKILIPGVITHHTISVEHPDLVANRIEQFAKLVGRENVMGGTDCGFAQVEFVQRVHPSIMWAKFEALVEGAQIASKRLWS